MSDQNKLTDEELLRDMRNESSGIQAFEVLYDRYWSKLYLQAYNRIRSREAAEEIVQDFFTSLWTKRKELKIGNSFSSYMYSAVRYNVINHWQKEYVRKRYRQDVSNSDRSDVTEDAIGLSDLKKLINAELSKLPDRCRLVYTLSRNDYMSNKDIARQLGISEKTVENQLTKALNKLKLSLKNAYTSFLLLMLYFLL